MFEPILQEYEALAPKPEKPEHPALTFDSEDTEPIAQLVLTLQRNDPVRNLAMSLLAGRGVDLPDPSPLIRAVNGCRPRDWRRGAAAAWCLANVNLSAEDRASVASRLAAIVDNRIPYDHLGAAFGRLFKVCGAITALVILPILLYTAPNWIGSLGALLATAIATVMAGTLFFLLLSGVVVGPFLVPLSVAADKSRVNRVRAQAAETLGALGQPESVDVLADAAHEIGSRVRNPAHDALLRILPTLTEQHRGTLSAQTVPNLCRLLDDSEMPTTLDILRALERIGDGRAVKPVQLTIIRWSLRLPNSAVRKEAERILPVLLQRQRQEQASSILLRAADHSLNEVLVRPAASAPSEDSATLVRPVESVSHYAHE